MRGMAALFLEGLGMGCFGGKPLALPQEMSTWQVSEGPCEKAVLRARAEDGLALLLKGKEGRMQSICGCSAPR